MCSEWHYTTRGLAYVDMTTRPDGLVVMSPSANLPHCVIPFWTHAHAFSLYDSQCSLAMQFTSDDIRLNEWYNENMYKRCHESRGTCPFININDTKVSKRCVLFWSQEHYTYTTSNFLFRATSALWENHHQKKVSKRYVFVLVTGALYIYTIYVYKRQIFCSLSGLAPSALLALCGETTIRWASRRRSSLATGSYIFNNTFPG